MKKLTEKQFLEQTNKNARVRTFDIHHYHLYCLAVNEAKKAARKHTDYFWEINAGNVANKYGYPATTAQAGVFVSPDGTIIQIVHRTGCGRHVSSIFHGGKSAYERWFRQLPLRVLKAISEHPAQTEQFMKTYKSACENGWCLLDGVFPKL